MKFHIEVVPTDSYPDKHGPAYITQFKTGAKAYRRYQTPSIRRSNLVLQQKTASRNISAYDSRAS